MSIYKMWKKSFCSPSPPLTFSLARHRPHKARYFLGWGLSGDEGRDDKLYDTENSEVYREEIGARFEERV